MKNFRVRIVNDTDARNPFSEDGFFDLMYKFDGSITDLSNGDIYKYLHGYLSDNQLIYNREKLIKLMSRSFDFEDIYDKTKTKDEKIDLLSDCLMEFLQESIFNAMKFCQMFKIKHSYRISKGYSQGDVAYVLIVPTPSSCDRLGVNIKKVKQKQLERQMDVFNYWCWGDVYGYIIEVQRKFKKIYDDGQEVESSEWEEVDACWGFYGLNPVENGMVDNIDYKEYGWNKKELIEIIKNTSVEYRS